MTGRGRSRGQSGQQQQQQQARKGGGRGNPQQTPQPPQGSQAPFVAAPAPTTSAWGRSPQAAASGPAPAQSAWARPQEQPVVQVGMPAYRGSSESKGRGRPQPQSEQHQSRQPQAGPSQAGPSQASPSQAGSSQLRTRGNGGNGAPADRGSIRGRTVITDIIKTKPESLLTKRGKKIGTEVLLTTNHFRLVKKPNWQLYQYRVDFNPPIDLRGFRNKLIFEQKKTLGGYLFDGSMLFLTVKLHDDVTIFMSKDRDGTPIQTTVKFVTQVSMLTASSLQILNLILRRSMEALQLQLVGRNFFDAVAKIDISQFHLELWPGYVTSIRQHESDILMCAEITNKVMRTETIYDIMQNIYKNERNFRSAFTTAVLGMTVLTAYNNKTYRIDDVNFDMTPASTFDTKNGAVSYVEYYRNKYNLTITDMRQPLLISKASARDLRAGGSETISLIPQLCRATGLNERMRGDYRLMAAVANYTRLAPKMRIEKLNAFNQRLQNTKESVENFKEWNCQLDTRLVDVPGQVIPNEKILFGNNKSVATNADADWSREFRNTTMYVSRNCDNWVLIYPNHKTREVNDFLSVLEQASSGMRFQLGQPFKLAISQDSGTAYANALDDAANRNPQLIMAVLLNSNAEKYSIIKKKLCDDRAIPSQVMLLKTITPRQGKDKGSLLTVGTKVAIQMNCKLGGAPWMVNIPVAKLMVVGYDVCHDTKDKSLSYGALVATMDQQCCQNYFSAVTPHKNGEELSNNFALNLSKALQCYKEQHKYLPERIYIYRDGVGEGQTNYVIEHEVNNIRRKLDEIYGGVNYKFMFVVVSKRINTRFFNKGNNPIPGTVVDDVVTLPERYDFFLISQSVKQGTVSPTNYNILHDGSGLPPERIQQFTYKLTHLYYNWSGTLGVPAVCQYAHKLAFLVGNFIHRSPSSRLEKQLYFL